MARGTAAIRVRFAYFTATSCRRQRARELIMVEITAELKAGEERADRGGDSAGQLIAGQVSETDIMGSGRGHEHAKRGRQRRREIRQYHP